MGTLVFVLSVGHRAFTSLELIDGAQRPAYREHLRGADTAMVLSPSVLSSTILSAWYSRLHCGPVRQQGFRWYHLLRRPGHREGCLRVPFLRGPRICQVWKQHASVLILVCGI
ncbi:hypothetical protein C8Q72DRAFT_834422 [Fomitopsis betulina]|nr:hypothetical protein C8Q72DRAFT_834422 [Fomitopsis betulina]